jgi:hypothetical protein
MMGRQSSECFGSKEPYFPGVRPALKKSYALKILQRRKQKKLTCAIQVDERWIANKNGHHQSSARFL